MLVYGDHIRSDNMAIFTINELKIEGRYPVHKVLEFSMHIGANFHGNLTYGGLISERDAIAYIQKSADMQSVKVTFRDELEFCGFPQMIEVNHQNEHYYLRVSLVTSTQLMDIEKHNRFFQELKQTCFHILTEAYNDSKIGVLSGINAKDRVFSPILQYCETDWQLTMRLASNLSTVIFPNVTVDKPQLILGIPKRQIFTENNNIVYDIKRNNAKFLENNSVFVDIQYHDFISCKLRSNSRYKLGDSILYDDKVLVVMQKMIKYIKGEFQELYVLGCEHEYAVPLHQNMNISGLELEGIVLESNTQNMRVILDIDTHRKNDGEKWFAYSPVTNNGMYSMPLEGEKIMLQWQSEYDYDALAIRPIRRNGEGMQFRERHFQTEHKNHLMMVSDKVEYTNPVGSIKWLAGSGFDISTNKNISVSAGWDINITSQTQVEATSPERITACKADVESSIDMIGGDLHIKAKGKVTVKSKADKYKKTTLPDRTQHFKIGVATASKLAAAIPQVLNAKK
jgi:hypothetical protein